MPVTAGTPSKDFASSTSRIAPPDVPRSLRRSSAVTATGQLGTAAANRAKFAANRSTSSRSC